MAKKKKLRKVITQLMKERDKYKEYLHTILEGRDFAKIAEIHTVYTLAKDIEVNMWYGKASNIDKTTPKNTNYDTEMAERASIIAQATVYNKKAGDNTGKQEPNY